MLAEKAVELIRELDRSSDLLPPHNEDLIRQALEEMKLLFQQNQIDVLTLQNGDHSVLPSIQCRHASLERNKRCLLAYLYNRLMKLKEMRWELGSVLPPDIKMNMSEQETSWFHGYNKLLANYMKSVGEHGGLDLTQDINPPKTLYVEVRCLIDHGELETSDGSIVLLRKNSQLSLLRSECEHLIRQGVLEHIVS